MPKKHFNRQNICIYASELASLRVLIISSHRLRHFLEYGRKTFPDYEKVFKSKGESAKPKETIKLVSKK